MKKRKPWTLKDDLRYREIYQELRIHGMALVRVKTLAERDFKHRMLIAYEDGEWKDPPYILEFRNEFEYDRIAGVRRRNMQYMIIVRRNIKPFKLKDQHNEKTSRRKKRTVR